MQRYHWIIFIALAGMGNIPPIKAIENNLSFNGALVSEPCDLDPLTTDISVDFGTVVEKYLYTNTRTSGKSFTINLINCDISLGNLATITFKGTESTALPGLLAVTGTVSGIAIGIEFSSGLQLPINEPTQALPLNEGTSSYTFQAYVEGEPGAIDGREITPGEFTSVATFEISYV